MTLTRNTFLSNYSALLLVVSVVFALQACDLKTMFDDELSFCKDVALELTKSPSTFKYVKGMSIIDGEEKIANIEFDAQNAYGGIVRQKVACKFRVSERKGGWFPEIIFETTPYSVSVNGSELEYSVREVIVIGVKVNRLAP